MCANQRTKLLPTSRPRGSSPFTVDLWRVEAPRSFWLAEKEAELSAKANVFAKTVKFLRSDYIGSVI